jgi:hypothetical protein
MMHARRTAVPWRRSSASSSERSATASHRRSIRCHSLARLILSRSSPCEISHEMNLPFPTKGVAACVHSGASERRSTRVYARPYIPRSRIRPSPLRSTRCAPRRCGRDASKKNLNLASEGPSADERYSESGRALLGLETRVFGIYKQKKCSEFIDDPEDALISLIQTFQL